MTADVARVTVPSASGPYEALIGIGLLSRPDTWARHARNGRLVIVADERAWRHHGEAVFKALALANLRLDLILRRGGEASKSWPTLQRLLDQLLELRIERSEPVVAMGGGVIGDLTGFAAAILKRGCPVLQVPTTLLAQVDSAIGGKTAINTKHGKNLVGAFHPPAAAIVDPVAIATLPLRHRRNGLAEVIKHAIIADSDFFAWCESHAAAVLACDQDALLQAVATCVRIKGSIVSGDEQDRNGQRAILNFGHSFAHALEAETGYSNRLLHGEAVAIGMILALRLSVELGHCKPALAGRCERLLETAGLPTSLRQVAAALDTGRLVERMQDDKKAVNGAPTLVLVRDLARPFLTDAVAPAQLHAFLNRQLAS